jgi:CxxC motif-containing protein
MKHVYTCIKCPLGCEIEVFEENGDITEVTGHTCPQGREYAIEECKHPERMVTTTVRVKKGVLPVVPVRSKNPVPKGKVKECVNMLSTVAVEAPVECGEVVCENILGTGVDIVASRDLGKGRKNTTQKH